MYRGEGVSASGGAGFRGKSSRFQPPQRGGGGGFGDRGGRGPGMSRGFGDRGGRGFGDRGGRGFGDRGGRGFGDRGGRGFGDRGGRGFGDRGGRGFGARGGRGFGDRGGRGSFGRGGRGGFQQQDSFAAQAQNQRKHFNDSDSDRDGSASDGDDAPLMVREHRAAAGGNGGGNSGPAQVQTIVRDDGTEVPAKLNNKVFIDGLPYEDAPGGVPLFDQLRDFAAEWKVGKAVALLKRPGQGFGYLAFRSPHCVEVAVKVLNGRKFRGRCIRVELPKPPKDPKEGGYKRPDAASTPYDRQVLLSDLSKLAEPEVIREVVREFAPALEPKVESIKMVASGRKAFVTMESEEDVEPFITFMHGFRLLGRNVCAEAAKAPGSLPFSRPTGPKPSAAQQQLGVTGAAAPVAEEPAAPMSAVEKALAGLTGSVADASIAGSNAKKKFPMPDVLTAAAAPVAAAPTPKPLSTGDRASRFDFADRGAKEVIVGNLTDDTTEDDLRRHFANCGRVTKAEVLVNPHTREPVGLARVTFAISGQAKVACQSMNGSRLHGNALRVDREGADEQEVVAGPMGIDAADSAAAQSMAAAAAKPAGPPITVEAAPEGGKKKKNKRPSRGVQPEARDEFEVAEDNAAAADELASRYGVSKATVLKMINDEDAAKASKKADAIAAGAGKAKREAKKGDADPSKRRLSQKELIEQATEQRQKSGKSAATKEKAKPMATSAAVVSFDDNDDDAPAAHTAAAGADDSDDEEVFTDAPRAGGKAAAGGKAGKKKASRSAAAKKKK